MKRSYEESLDIQSHKRSRMIPTMDQIANNPGFQNIIELIFLNLDFEDLQNCQLINKSCKKILNNPMFWLKKWRFGQGLSQKNYSDWAEIIQMTRDTNMEENVRSYIKKIVQIGHFMVDVPCFIDYEAIRKFSPVWTFKKAIIQKEFGILQIIASKKKNWNVQVENRLTLIYKLSQNNDMANAIKVLVPLIENPNSPGFLGATPIVIGALQGCLDVVQALIPYINNANESGIYRSPIRAAIHNGHKEIVKILAPLCDDYLYSSPDSGSISGNLIHFAIACNKPESIKVFAPFMDNTNAPDSNGLTPLEMAQNKGLDDIVKFLKKTIASKVSL